MKVFKRVFRLVFQNTTNMTLKYFSLFQNLQPIAFELPNGDRVVIQIMVRSVVFINLYWFFPSIRIVAFYHQAQTMTLRCLLAECILLRFVRNSNFSKLTFVFQCRMAKTSYKGRLSLTLNWSLNGKVQDIIEDVVGSIPIMVKVSFVDALLFFTI